MRKYLTSPDISIHDPDVLPFSLMLPDDGMAIRYHFDEFMLNWISSLSAELMECECMSIVSEYVDEELIRMYLEEVIYVEGVEYIRQLYRRKLCKDYLNINVHSKVKCPMSIYPIIKKYWIGECLISRNYFLDIKKKVVKKLRKFKAFLYEKNKHCKIIDKQVYPKTNVAVELVEGIDPTSKSDAFWLNADIVDPRRVFFLVEKKNSFAFDIDQEIKTAKKLNVNLFTIDSEMAVKHHLLYWKEKEQPKWIDLCLKKLNVRKKSEIEQWVSSTLAGMVSAVGYWEELFNDLDIAVYQDFTELSKDSIIRRIAIDRTSGIEIGKQRSQYFSDASPAFHFMHEVVFCWHDRIKNSLKISNTRTKKLVTTGYIYDYLLEASKNEANILRDKLEKKGCDVVISVYDNFPNKFNHLSWEQLHAFYSCLYEVLMKNNSLGIIIKSKKPQIVNSRNLETIFKKLEGSERCIILDIAFTSVIPSALACDVAVGYPASTAVTEASLTGCHVLVYDPSHAPINPFECHERNYVFDELEQFQSRLIELVTGGCGDSVNESLASNIDSFQDGFASLRAAWFINEFLNERDRGTKKEYALSSASSSISKFITA